MKYQIDFAPTEKQFTAWWWLTNNIVNELLYGWWARWGKSFLWCTWLLIMCWQLEWSQWLMWRNELKRLKATTLLTFFEVCKHFNIPDHFYHYNGWDWTIDFQNWSKIFLVDLSYMPSDPLYDRLWSYWLTWQFIDEAQEVHEQAINTLKGRFSVLTWTNSDWSKWKTIPKSLYTCNPWKWWIYNDFFSPWKNWTLIQNKMFVPSLVTDNKHIEQEYIDFLSTADKITQERLLKGNFDYDDTPWKLYSFDKLNDLFTNPINNWDKCITCDVARHGRDRAIIWVWNWFEIINWKVYDTCSLADLDEQIETYCQTYKIWKSMVLVDEDWVGWWLVDMLWCKWFVNWSRCIDSRNKEEKLQSMPRPNFANLKTQCYFALCTYIENNVMNLKFFERYRPDIIEELDTLAEVDADKDTPKKLISKDEQKQVLRRSPDFWDMIMMRMYFTLVPKKIHVKKNTNTDYRIQSWARWFWDWADESIF